MKVLKPTTIPFPSSGQFIRNSTATYIDDGILKTAAVNEPRWQDGVLLLEDSATNAAAYSGEFSAGYRWATDGISTLTGMNDIGPDGLLTATFFERGTNVYAYTAVGNDGVPPGFDTISIFAKKRDGGNLLTIGLEHQPPLSTSEYSQFNLNTGTIVSSNGLAGIQKLANGWYRLWARTSTGVTPGFVALYMTDTTVSGTGVLIDKFQVEAGNVSSYIQTAATAVTRASDICIGNFSRDSVGIYRDTSGNLQTAGVNVPRVQDGRLLVEAAATNYCLNNNSATPFLYVDGDSNGNMQVISDPFWGNVLRVTKTSGTPGEINRVGLRWTLPAIPSPTMTGSIWIRKPNTSIIGAAIYVDSIRTDSSWSSAAKPITDVNGTEWVSATVSINSGGLLHNGGACYTWLNGNVGDYIDVALPCVFSGSIVSSSIVTAGSPVTRAADIHTAGLVYSTATDATASYSNATSYAIGDLVKYNNKRYESLQAANLNHTPNTSPTWWLELGADNVAAAFDEKVGSKTITADRLRMIIYPGTAVDAVGYLETNASIINTSVVSFNKELIYSNSTGITENTIENWYDYFFVSALSEPASQVVHRGISALDPNVYIGVDMINTGNVELGSFLTGLSTTLGKTQYGLKAGIVDYSRKEADDFGNVSIVERPYSKRMSGDVYVNNYDLNKVQRFLYSIRATPVLWMASDNPELAEVSYVYGFYKDFSTTIAYPDVSMCNVEIEGMI